MHPKSAYSTLVFADEIITTLCMNFDLELLGVLWRDFNA